MTSMTGVAPTRRALIGRSAAVGLAGSAAAIGLPGLQEAAHAGTYRPARYRGITLLSKQSRHLVSRMSYGITPALAREVRAAGGGRAWFERQLQPEAIRDTDTERFESWWPSFQRSAADIWDRQRREVEGGWEVMQDYERWVMLRRMHSQRQVLEVMTEFWENHLHVPATGDPCATWRVGYGRMIREHALGRFDEMLQAAITHPAMLIFLDGGVSTAQHPNENLGRELLELHTVGRGNYDEEDVKSSARILTGYRIDMWKSFAASYRPDDHWVGPVRVMGFSHANSAADGRAVVREYLTYLAHHPATAQRIARKLAVKFVSDEPPAELVDQLARVYLTSGTDITEVLRALVASPAFKGSVGQKVRDPGEDVVATYRVLRVRVSEPTDDRSAVNQMLWQAGNLGIMPFAWARPDGQPVDNETWASPTRLVASMEMHFAMSGRWWPTEGIAYRNPRAWLPRRKIRFDKLVDHLAQQLLHQRSDAQLLEACCQAVGVQPREQITPGHGLVKWNSARLLTTFLDSPAHLTR